jgi:hypothetical protein
MEAQQLLTLAQHLVEGGEERMALVAVVAAVEIQEQVQMGQPAECQNWAVRVV